MGKTYNVYDEVFSEVYEKYHIYLLKYLLLFVHDFTEAEDMVQEIFVRIYKSRNSEITGEKFRNYIKKAARNIAIDHARKSARDEARNKRMIHEVKEYNENFYSNLENSIIDGEIISTVNDFLEKYSEINRKVFIARVIEEKSRREVSEEVNISPYEIKKIENEIFHGLREKLKKYF